MIILAIDPGTEQSASVFYDTGVNAPGVAALVDNDLLLRGLRLRTDALILGQQGEDIIVCEMVQHYGSGLAVGKETFETVRWIGRFQEAVEARGGRFEILYRPAIKAHLCGSAKAKDGNVRQALIDRFGGDSVALKGKKCPCVGAKRIRTKDCKHCEGSGWLRKPGPLAGITSHMWAALAVAVTWAETQKEKP